MPFFVFDLLKLFAKYVFPSVTMLAKVLATIMHFRLRLCFLGIVPFNLKWKLQLLHLKWIINVVSLRGELHCVVSHKSV